MMEHPTIAESDMTDPTDALILDLVEWVAERPRSYDDVMEAWRTSCPRLTIWEDALDRGFVKCERDESAGAMVRATTRGRELLREAGRVADVPA